MAQSRGGANRVSAPSRKRRLILEALEARCVPATAVWTGALSSNWSVAGNWSTGAAPIGTDDVVFDGHVSNNDCVFTGGLYSQAANSLTMNNGYSGTLHLQQFGPWNIGGGGINQSSGNIEQENNQDMEVGGNYNWSGGNVDAVSPLLGNITMYEPGTNMQITGNETTGANLVIKAGCTITMTDPNGTTTFKNAAGISIAATANFNWTDGTIATMGANIGVIANAGTFQKRIGTKSVTTALPIQNSNVFQFLQGTLTITGKDADGHGYSQTAGSTDLSNDVTLISSAGDVYINGGNFWTEGAHSYISADVTFNGGTINLNHNTQTSTGRLVVVGNLTIQGTATWVCKVDCTTAFSSPDQISASKTITIGGNSTFQAQAINVPAGGVQAGSIHTFLIDSGMNAIVGKFGTTILTITNPPGKLWKISPNPANTTWTLIF